MAAAAVDRSGRAVRTVRRAIGRPIALPITLQDEVDDDERSERSLLVLDEGAPSPVTADSASRSE